MEISDEIVEKAIDACELEPGVRQFPAMRAALAAVLPDLVKAAVEREREEVKMKDNNGLFTGSHFDPRLTASMDNVLAWRLGEAANAAMTHKAGDYIDRGLALLKELNEAGFDVAIRARSTKEKSNG